MQTTCPTRRAGSRADQGTDRSAGAAFARLFRHRPLVGRLIQIRQLLAGSKGLPLTAAAIAEHFEVSTKTIYRDIETLRTVGAIKTWTNQDGLNVHGYILAETSCCPFCGSTKN